MNIIYSIWNHLRYLFWISKMRITAYYELWDCVHYGGIYDDLY